MFRGVATSTRRNSLDFETRLESRHDKTEWQVGPP